MKAHETEKFEKYGSFFYLLLAGAGVGLPFLLSLCMCLSGEVQWNVFLPMALGYAIVAWIVIISLLAYGMLTSIFMKRTVKEIDSLPYKFNSSFKSRNGILYIDVANGMVGFISAYNPLKLQIFDAARIDKAEALTSRGTFCFVFYLDGNKITMPTLITNRIVSTKSGIGAEAVGKANTFVELLLTAKCQAEVK